MRERPRPRRVRDGGQGRDPLGAVVRSDSPAALTGAGRAALAEYGVRAIVDLRLPAELADYPNPFAEPGDHGIAYVNVSIIDPGAGFPRHHHPGRELPVVAGAVPRPGRRRRDGRGPGPRGRRAGPLRRRQGPYRADLGPAAGARGCRPRRSPPTTPSPPSCCAPGPGVAGARPRRAGRARGHPGQVRPHRRGHAGGPPPAGRRHGGVEPYLLEAGVAPADLDRLRDRLLAGGPETTG